MDWNINWNFYDSPNWETAVGTVGDAVGSYFGVDGLGQTVVGGLSTAEQYGADDLLSGMTSSPKSGGSSSSPTPVAAGSAPPTKTSTASGSALGHNAGTVALAGVAGLALVLLLRSKR